MLKLEHKLTKKQIKNAVIALLVLLVFGLLLSFLPHQTKKESLLTVAPSNSEKLNTNLSDLQKDIKEEKIYSIPSDQKNFNDLYAFFSPDGKRMAYAITQGSGWAVVVDGQIGEVFDSFGGPVIFSPDSSHFAYTGIRNAKEQVMVDNSVGPAYDQTFEPKTFTPDNRFFIYKAKQNGKYLMMVNSWASQLYDEIYRMNITTDKKNIFLFARQGQDFYRITISLDKAKELN